MCMSEEVKSQKAGPWISFKLIMQVVEISAKRGMTEMKTAEISDDVLIMIDILSCVLDLLSMFFYPRMKVGGRVIDVI